MVQRKHRQKMKTRKENLTTCSWTLDNMVFHVGVNMEGRGSRHSLIRCDNDSNCTCLLSWNCQHCVMLVDPPSDMLAANMPKCGQCVTRHVGDMISVVTCPKQYWKTSIPTRYGIVLALQMLHCKICRHMTKIDSQSRCRRHVGCRPKQGYRE